MAAGNVKAQDSSNPLGEELIVDVSIPKQIKISMVDASVLDDYKALSYITGFSSNVFSGFVVALCTNSNSELTKILWAIVIVFFLITLYLGYLTYQKSKIMSDNQKIVTMKATK